LDRASRSLGCTPAIHPLTDFGEDTQSSYIFISLSLKQNKIYISSMECSHASFDEKFYRKDSTNNISMDSQDEKWLNIKENEHYPQ